MKRDHALPVSSTLLVASLVPLQLLVIGPLHVYSGNVAEFATSYFQLLPSLMLPALAATLAIAAFLRSLRGRWRDVGFGAVVAVSVLLWIQSSFLKWDYGVFDGRGINWSAAPLDGLVDLLVWAVVLGLGLVFARGIRTIAPLFATAFLVLQLVGGVAEILRNPAHLRKIKDAATGRARISDDMLAYSSKTNILHVILDGLSTDIFMEAVAADGLREAFQGFTVFTDNLAVAPHTPFAVPAIFLGQAYAGGETPSAFYTRAMRDGFCGRLQERGYRVNLVPYISMQDSKHDASFQIPSVYGGAERHARAIDRRKLLTTSLFVNSPHAAKRFLYNDGNWRFQSPTRSARGIAAFEAINFLRDYTARLHVGKPQPAYHFVHLMTPHPPFVTLADGTYAGKVLPNTRESLLNQTRAIVGAFLELLAGLESLGLYDNTFILLQGDHGSLIPPRVQGVDVPTVQPRIAALLAVKPIGARGHVRTSEAPSSTLDSRATLMAAAGIADSTEGTDVLTLGVDATARVRKYAVYSGRGDDASAALYHVRGRGIESNAWNLAKTVRVSHEERPYSYGEEIRFGMTGNSDSYLGPGWSAALQLGEICWSEGNRAVLRIPTVPPAGDVELVARLIPYVQPGAVDRQRIAVSVNGQPVTNWVGTRQEIQQFSATIPARMIAGTHTELSFDLPDAVSPRDIARGADPRVLGIALHRLTLRARPASRPRSSKGDAPRSATAPTPAVLLPGRTVHFGSGGTGEPLLVSGWSRSSDPEEKVTWSSGDTATLRFGVAQSVAKSEIKLTFIPFVVPGVVNEQRFRVSLDGATLGECVATDRVLTTTSLDVATGLQVGAVHHLQFVLPDAVSPASIGQGQDLRKLGIAIHSLQLNEK